MALLPLEWKNAGQLAHRGPHGIRRSLLHLLRLLLPPRGRLDHGVLVQATLSLGGRLGLGRLAVRGLVRELPAQHPFLAAAWTQSGERGSTAGTCRGVR